jgi:branched-chain amino acid transport system substrate-binding protein
VKKLWILMVVVGAMLMAAAGCKKKEVKEIRVGVVEAQSGMFAPFGEGGAFGIQQAVDDINKMGGVQVGDQKLPIRLVIVDNESDPNKSGQLAESLITHDEVKFLVSSEHPPHVNAGVSTIADRYKIPYITSVGPYESWMGMRSQSPTKWQYTWATGMFAIVTPATGDDFRAKLSGYTALDTWKSMLDQFGGKTNKKIAILASDDPDGHGWYSLFGPSLQKWGYTPVGLDKNIGMVPVETTDFTSMIKAWKDAGAEILWGNAPGPLVGAVWKQCAAMGFKPKIVTIGRGALYYNDVNAYGGELALGVGTEIWWSPTFKDSPGFGSTTPQSLAQSWKDAKHQPLNPAIGTGYRSMQVLVDAIQRAGSTDAEKVQAALAQTDMKTIGQRVKFDENHFSRGPLLFGQWFRVDTPEKWELRTTFALNGVANVDGKPIFPIPYK